jgi:hypothetical protein
MYYQVRSRDHRSLRGFLDNNCSWLDEKMFAFNYELSSNSR